LKLKPSGFEMQGFSLIEMLVATLILTFGLLAAGQLISASLASSSLSRSKETASIIAQTKAESLALLYRRNPALPDLTPGSHGPEQTEVLNPLDGRALNKFALSWIVATVPDPRAGVTLPARSITVTARPVDSAGSPNKKISLNKAVSISTLISSRLEWPK
jgi:prepilin-type N-terminal cleavage/methylation domain-containing protein